MCIHEHDLQELLREYARDRRTGILFIKDTSIRTVTKQPSFGALVNIRDRDEIIYVAEHLPVWHADEIDPRRHVLTLADVNPKRERARLATIQAIPKIRIPGTREFLRMAA